MNDLLKHQTRSIYAKNTLDVKKPPKGGFRRISFFVLAASSGGVFCLQSPSGNAGHVVVGRSHLSGRSASPVDRARSASGLRCSQGDRGTGGVGADIRSQDDGVFCSSQADGSCVVGNRDLAAVSDLDLIDVLAVCTGVLLCAFQVVITRARSAAEVTPSEAIAVFAP